MPRKQDPEKYCQNCGERMQRKRYKGVLEDMGAFRRRKFCNRKCMGDAQQKDNPTRSALMKRAEKYRGNQCGECRSKENLQTHHMDGDLNNNNPSNLKTLCASCHAKWHWQNGKEMPRRQSSCKVCGKPARKLDMCQKHYQRFRKYGDPLLTKKQCGSRFVLVREVPGQQSGLASPG